MPNPLNILIDHFAKLPGIGQRSARRMVLQLMRNREGLMQPLMQAMEQTLAQVIECEVCGNLDATSPCSICSDVRRDSSVICVVEELADLWAIERSHMFAGKYHILGGTLSAIDGRGPNKLRITQLIARARSEEASEIILAMNATVDGQTTAHYIAEQLSDANVKISRLAHGIPMGGELDYLDDGTLGAALKARVAS